MKKYVAAVFIAFVASCTQEQKDEQVSEEGTTCASKKMSNQQKADNNLFLTFYYGMTPSEFNKAQQELLKSGQLIRYDSTGALPRPDSTVKFLLIVDNKGPEKCFFTLSPNFEGCVLNAINLDYIPTYGSTAYFKEIGKSQEVPDITTANVIRRVYREKYGKPTMTSGHFLGGYNRYTWKSRIKEIGLYNKFGITQDMRGNDFRQISGIGVYYRSIEFDRKAKYSQDSVDKAERNELMKIKKSQEKSI